MATPLNVERRILVVGCSGAVGSQLISILSAQGYEILGVRSKRKCAVQNHICTPVDLLNPHVNPDFGDFRASSMILTSWITTPSVFWDSKSNEDWFEASKRVITRFVRNGGSYVAVTGTCAEYDWGLHRPLKESDIVNPASLYGRSKLDLLNWLTELGVPFLWTRTFAQFGLNEPKGRLVPSVIDALLNSEVATITNADGVRDFIFVEDIAKIISVLLTGNQIGVVNIGTGLGTNIGNLALEIGTMIGRPELVKIVEQNTKSQIVVAEITKLTALLGPFSWTPLDEALNRSIETRRQSLEKRSTF